MINYIFSSLQTSENVVRKIEEISKKIEELKRTRGE